GPDATTAPGNSVAGWVRASPASTFGRKLVSGFFAKKKADTPAAAPATTADTSTAPGMAQVAEFSSETTAITPGPVAATQFEVPTDWKLVKPKEREQKEVSCPGS